MDTIAIHCLWFLFGAACMFVGIVAIAPAMLSSRISQWQEAAQPMWTVEYDAPEPEPATPVVTVAALTEAQETAKFYQELYHDYQSLYLDAMSNKAK